MKALEMAWETRGKPVGVCSTAIKAALYEQAVPAVTVAIPDQAEYESAWKLLG
ncbi:putative transposase [Escherichia coli P0302308.3]|nr:putative transposase [Escherichia coli P0302308.3]